MLLEHAAGAVLPASWSDLVVACLLRFLLVLGLGCCAIGIWHYQLLPAASAPEHQAQRLQASRWWKLVAGLATGVAIGTMAIVS